MHFRRCENIYVINIYKSKYLLCDDLNNSIQFLTIYHLLWIYFFSMLNFNA